MASECYTPGWMADRKHGLDRYVAVYEYRGAIRTLQVFASSEPSARRKVAELVAAPIETIIREEVKEEPQQ